jgi:hypothetical protein
MMNYIDAFILYLKRLTFAHYLLIVVTLLIILYPIALYRNKSDDGKIIGTWKINVCKFADGYGSIGSGVFKFEGNGNLIFKTDRGASIFSWKTYTKNRIDLKQYHYTYRYTYILTGDNLQLTRNQGNKIGIENGYISLQRDKNDD